MASASSRRNSSMTARESPQKQAEQTVLPVTCCHSVTKRLQQDLMTLMMKPVESVTAFPAGDNLFLWHGTIKGSVDTVYEGLEYRLSLEFSAKYPIEPPVVKFITPCFHPNVDDKGNICLDILKEQWSALYDVKTVLISIQSLLAEPNNESPLNSYAATLWENQEEYKAVLCKKYDKDAQQKHSK